jgi:hypothetical protein
MMSDEFENGRERGEAYPTMDAYCQSRTADQLAQLIYDETYRANVFGTYMGSNGLYSQSIIAAAARLPPAKSIKAWGLINEANGFFCALSSQEQAQSYAGIERDWPSAMIFRIVPVTITIDEVA